MKVVNLNKTHHLYEYGYTFALTFNSYSLNYCKCVIQLKKMYGDDVEKWYDYFDSYTHTAYIVFKNEEIITFLFLVLE